MNVKYKAISHLRPSIASHDGFRMCPNDCHCGNDTHVNSVDAYFDVRRVLKRMCLCLPWRAMCNAGIYR